MKGKVMASLMLIASASVSAATVREALAPALVELAFSPKQNALFVSAPDWKQEDKSRVLRLNPLTLKPEATIAQKVKAFGVALDEANHALFVTVKNDGAATKAGKLESVARIDD